MNRFSYNFKDHRPNAVTAEKFPYRALPENNSVKEYEKLGLLQVIGG